MTSWITAVFFCFLLKTRGSVCWHPKATLQSRKLSELKNSPSCWNYKFHKHSELLYTNNRRSKGTSPFDRANERCFLDPCVGRGRREKGVMETECSGQPALGTVLPVPRMRGCSALTQLLRSSEFTLFLAPSWEMQSKTEGAQIWPAGLSKEPWVFPGHALPYTVRTLRCRTPNQFPSDAYPEQWASLQHGDFCGKLYNCKYQIHFLSIVPVFIYHSPF